MSKTIFVVHENGTATLQEDNDIVQEVGASNGLFEAILYFNKLMKKRHLSYRLTSSFKELLIGCELKDKISITGIHICPTYRDRIPNEEVVADAEQKAAKHFGLPVHVFHPKTKINKVKFATDDLRLPCYAIMARLETFKIEGNFDGRKLTIVLFVDDIYSMPIDQIIGSAVIGLDWKKHSQLQKSNTNDTYL